MSRKLPIAITEEEFILLIKATPKAHHRMAFLFGFGAGLRVSEMASLKPEQVNIKERSIFIKQGKGGKDRIVPLPKGFKAEMIKLLPLKCKVRALQAAFGRAANRAGLLKTKPELHIHSLRHGFASQMARNGVPIHYIRTLLGHANVATTNVYLELNPKDALKSYEELF